MATPDPLLAAGARRDAVVRPLSRAAERPCARPGCPTPARATLTFAYAQREAWLERLHDTDEPQAYDLCGTHASRTRPPHGWSLRDRRPPEERDIDPPPVTPADLGGERTVAVLAAALRAVPDVAPESDDRSPQPLEIAPDDAGAAVTASAQEDAPVAAGPTFGSDPEDPPSPVLGADRASPTLDDAVPFTAAEDVGRSAADAAAATRPPLAVRDDRR